MLINPPHWMNSGIWNCQNAGLGLASIASFLQEVGWDVTIHEMEVMRFDWEAVTNAIHKRIPDIVGITGTSLGRDSILRTAKIAKKAIRGCKVIVGGAHASALPEDLRVVKEIDLVITGQADHKALACLFKNNTGIWRMDGNRYEIDMNKLPMPAYDIIDPPIGSRYYRGNDPIMARPETVIMWSRGCPHHCIFCSKAVHGRYFPFLKNPQKVCDEIEYLQDKFGIKTFFVYDDELIGLSKKHNEWMESICQEIIDRGIVANFKGQGRCSKRFVNDKTLSMMREAGFKAMMMGCESGSLKVLKAMRKGTTPDDIRFTLPKLMDNGIDVFGFWMIGNVEETEEDAMKTYELVSEMLPYMKEKQVTILNPLPASYLWDMAIEKGWLKYDETIWSRMHQKTPMLEMPWMTHEQIVKWRDILVSL